MKPRPFYYRLDENREPVEATREEFTELMESKDARLVARSHFTEGARKLFVSTVFLSIDHCWGDGLPILFETMIFTEGLDLDEEFQERYRTWDEALAGHEQACQYVLKLYPKARRKDDPCSKK